MMVNSIRMISYHNLSPVTSRYFYSPENNLLIYSIGYLNFGYSILLKQWLSNFLVSEPLHTLRNYSRFQKAFVMWVTMFNIKTEKCLTYLLIYFAITIMSPFYVI